MTKPDYTKPYTRDEVLGILSRPPSALCEVVLTDEQRNRLFATIERGYAKPKLHRGELVNAMLSVNPLSYGVPSADWNLWELTKVANDCGYAVTIETQPGCDELHVSIATGAFDKRTFWADDTLSAGNIIAAFCYDHIRDPFDEKKDVSHFFDPYEVE